MSNTRLVVIVPASNEENYIHDCLAAVAGQKCGGAFLTIVSANACIDGTVEQARNCSDLFISKGHELIVLSSSTPGKVAALNRAEDAIPPELQGLPRLFLDADVTCDSDLFLQILNALETSAPRFATGKLTVTEAKSSFTRAYARIWCRLPFVKEGVTGAGLFAVNAAGRKRWEEFPQIISDDTFVRLSFSPEERIEVRARYYWPMAEGLSALIKVRRRQDQGVREVYENYPQLIDNERKRSVTAGEILSLLLAMPVSILAYLLVHILTRLIPSSEDWSRGR